MKCSKVKCKLTHCFALFVQCNASHLHHPPLFCCFALAGCKTNCIYPHTQIHFMQSTTEQALIVQCTVKVMRCKIVSASLLQMHITASDPHIFHCIFVPIQFKENIHRCIGIYSKLKELSEMSNLFPLDFWFLQLCIRSSSNHCTPLLILHL